MDFRNTKEDVDAAGMAQADIIDKKALNLYFRPRGIYWKDCQRKKRKRPEQFNLMKAVQSEKMKQCQISNKLTKTCMFV